jgi:hypothetical protein
VRGVGVRSALAVGFACACVRLAAACSSDYGGQEAPGSGDATSDATDDVPSVVEAGSDVKVCPPRYMPAEGTYAFTHGFSGDRLSLGDSAAPTEDFDNPFFATVTHEANACFRFTAYLADGWDGGRGGHHHSWLFCNACDRSQPSLDLVEETDIFKAKELPLQRTNFTCLRPNPYLTSDVPIDGSIEQAGCLGKGSGGATNEVLVVPKEAHYLGLRNFTFRDEPDTGVDTHAYERVKRTVILDGVTQKDGKSNFFFDVDSGMIIAADLVASTSTRFGSLDVAYDFTLFFRPVSSTASPLHRDQ